MLLPYPNQDVDVDTIHGPSDSLLSPVLICAPSVFEWTQTVYYTCPSAMLCPSQNLSVLVLSVLVHTVYKYTAIFYSFHIDIKVGFGVVFYFFLVLWIAPQWRVLYLSSQKLYFRECDQQWNFRVIRYLHSTWLDTHKLSSKASVPIYTSSSSVQIFLFLFISCAEEGPYLVVVWTCISLM